MADPYAGMNGEYAFRLRNFITAAEAAGFRIGIGSGFRSEERQQQLWDAALAKYGDPEIADNWVARPGHSNHGKGIAADLTFGSAAAREWAHANAAAFGLVFPMSWEPWHIEPLGADKLSDPGAYTTPPPGHLRPGDIVDDPYDIGTQFQNFLGSMSLSEQMANLATPTPAAAPDQGLVTQPEDIAGTMASEGLT